jgi:hypothetical protein
MMFTASRSCRYSLTPAMLMQARNLLKTRRQELTGIADEQEVQFRQRQLAWLGWFKLSWLLWT